MGFRKPTGTATTDKVLSGYTFSNDTSDGLEGSIISRSASSATIASAITYYAGYYANNWTVTPSSSSTKVRIHVVYGNALGTNYNLFKFYYNVSGGTFAGPYTDTGADIISISNKAGICTAYNAVGGLCGGISIYNEPVSATGYNAGNARCIFLDINSNASGLFFVMGTP